MLNQAKAGIPHAKAWDRFSSSVAIARNAAFPFRRNPGERGDRLPFSLLGCPLFMAVAGRFPDRPSLRFRLWKFPKVSGLPKTDPCTVRSLSPFLWTRSTQSPNASTSFQVDADTRSAAKPPRFLRSAAFEY